MPLVITTSKASNALRPLQTHINHKTDERVNPSEHFSGAAAAAGTAASPAQKSDHPAAATGTSAVSVAATNSAQQV